MNMCTTCEGTGLQDANTLCPVCNGSGTVEGAVESIHEQIEELQAEEAQLQQSTPSDEETNTVSSDNSSENN